MGKEYRVPNIESKLLKRINAAGLVVLRRSKDVVKLYPKDDVGIQYKRYYSFHIDFVGGQCDAMNINEYTSSYKRATIWVKPEELQLMLDVKQELTRLLEVGEF